MFPLLVLAGGEKEEQLCNILRVVLTKAYFPLNRTFLELSSDSSSQPDKENSSVLQFRLSTRWEGWV
jgi:hypothetical protein